MTTFTHVPAPGAAQSVEPKVRATPFGDGYSQRVGDGINTLRRMWSLRFTRETADIDDIEDFLRGEGGVTSFDWTPPSGAAGKWVCSAWSRMVNEAGVEEVHATFKEVFGE